MCSPVAGFSGQRAARTLARSGVFANSSFLSHRIIRSLVRQLSPRKYKLALLRYQAMKDKEYNIAVSRLVPLSKVQIKLPTSSRKHLIN